MNSEHASRRLILPSLAVGLVILCVALESKNLLVAFARNVGALSLNQFHAFVEQGKVQDISTLTSGEYFLNWAVRTLPDSSSTQRLFGYLYLAQEEERLAIERWRQVENIVDELLFNGARSEEAGDYATAIAWYERVLALDPTQVTASLRVGALYEKLGDWDRAELAYSMGMSTVPDNSDLTARIAWVYYQQNREEKWTQILELAEQAIAANDFLHDWNRIQSHFVRGEALRGTGRKSEALEEFEWVTEHNPDHYWALIRLAELTWELEQDDERAEEWFTQAIAVDPYSKWAYRYLALLYNDTGRMSEASSLFGQVLQIDPNDPLAIEWLARK